MSLFVFDPIGNLASNRIQNELHTLSSINGVDHNYLIPEFAPFYDESLVLVDATTGMALVKDIDYIFVYSFYKATQNIGKPISGAIAFLNPNITGSFRLNYQTIGGEFVDEITRSISNGIDTLVSLQSRKWEDIVDIPTAFPPTPHTHRLDQVVGISEILAKFTELEAAIKAPPTGLSVADISDLNSGFFDPLIQGMAQIAASIYGLALSQDRYYLEANAGTVYRRLDDIVPATWVDLGVAVTVTFEGTYQIIYSGNAYISASPDKPLTYRFTVNGEAISQSSLNGTLVGLAVGDRVSLQVRHNEPVNSNIVVANIGLTCGLNLVRISI